MIHKSHEWARRMGLAKQSKYRAVRCEVDGIKFHSKKEAKRWCVLKALERDGQIRDLIRQVRYPLKVKGVKIGEYVADFVYRAWNPPCGNPNWETVIEDAKGCKTPLYRWKKKHFEVQYETTILET